jgi:uncharacterized membrane protein
MASISAKQLSQTDAQQASSARGRVRSASIWLLVLSLIMFIWIGLPWLAPIFMKMGWDSLAKPIYWLYSFQCHQLPQRSFFLFGPQSMYSLSEVQEIWQNTNNPLILRQFIGSPELGFKVAWSDRMISAYSSILVGGVLWYFTRKRLRLFPIWVVVLLALPMAIDGVSHMVSDLAGIGEGFRYTNEWLAQLTQYRLPSSFYEGTTIGSFNSWMRLISGTFFGVGAGWFVFSSLGAVLSRPALANAEREVILQTD